MPNCDFSPNQDHLWGYISSMGRNQGREEKVTHGLDFYSAWTLVPTTV
jgi:hypothetical protein